MSNGNGLQSLGASTNRTGKLAQFGGGDTMEKAWALARRRGLEEPDAGILREVMAGESLSGKLTSGVQSLLGHNVIPQMAGVPRESQNQLTLGDIASFGLESTPVLGDAKAIEDAMKSAQRGDYGLASISAASVIPFVPAISGTIAGIGAKNADKVALKMAGEMAEKGVDRDEIWRKTGWFQGPDKKWRFEIDDSAASGVSYQYSPKQAVENAKKRAIIEDSPELSQRARSMEPYAGKTEADLRDEYRRTGEEIMKAAKEKDFELAERLYEERSGLSAILEEMGSREYGPMSAYLKHDELNKAYPELSDIHTRIGSEGLSGDLGQYRYPSSDSGEQISLMRPPASGRRAKSTGVHELQHAIQGREGFARGGNPREFYPPGVRDMMIQEKIDELAAGASKSTPREKIVRQAVEWVDSETGRRAYASRLAGETEARAVQKRMNLTPEERAARPFWLDYDVPEEQQIVR